MSLDPKVDLVFKKLFATEENKDLLMSLINAILPKDEQIVSLELRNPYQMSDYIGGKNSILDIKAEDSNGHFFNIEMQVKYYDFYPKRTLFHWAKMFSTQLDSSPNRNKHSVYKELTKCVVISFMNFTFFKKDDKYLRCIIPKDRETNETHESLDYMELYFIELPKFKEDLSLMNNVTKLQDDWLTFLQKGYSEDGQPQYLSNVDPLIQKAREQLRVMGLNELEQDYYEAQQKAILDHNSIVEQFEREKAEIDAGKAEIDAREAKLKKEQEEFEKLKMNERFEIVFRLLKTDVNNEFISLVTKFSEIEIQELREKMQSE